MQEHNVVQLIWHGKQEQLPVHCILHEHFTNVDQQPFTTSGSLDQSIVKFPSLPFVVQPQSVDIGISTNCTDKYIFLSFMLTYL